MWKQHFLLAVDLTFANILSLFIFPWKFRQNNVEEIQVPICFIPKIITNLYFKTMKGGVLNQQSPDFGTIEVRTRLTLSRLQSHAACGHRELIPNAMLLRIWSISFFQDILSLIRTNFTSLICHTVSLDQIGETQHKLPVPYWTQTCFMGFYPWAFVRIPWSIIPKRFHSLIVKLKLVGFCDTPGLAGIDWTSDHCIQVFQIPHEVRCF